MPGWTTRNTDAANGIGCDEWLGENIMGFRYFILIQGGLGPDVWDRELIISAADFRDACSQACVKAEELGGQVVLVEQQDYPSPRDSQRMDWLERTNFRPEDMIALLSEVNIRTEIDRRIASA